MRPILYTAYYSTAEAKRRVLTCGKLEALDDLEVADHPDGLLGDPALPRPTHKRQLIAEVVVRGLCRVEDKMNMLHYLF